MPLRAVNRGGRTALSGRRFAQGGVTMKLHCSLAVLATALLTLPAAAQTVGELVAKNIAARGGLSRLKATEALRLSGRVGLGPGLEAPFVLELKRPNRIRLEFHLQGMTGIEASDGRTSWTVMPFGGSKDPQPMPAEEAEQFLEQADFDGPLVDSGQKGHTVEYVGKEQVEGSDTFKLKVILRNGGIRYLFLDPDSFLEIRVEGRRLVRGAETEFYSSRGDYRLVEGLMVAHAIENGQRGGPERQTITIEKVELNPSIDDGRFVMPATSEPAPAKSGPGR
jgi:outer membrane lipoprotein-sorting protein